jgi:epsin
MLKQFHFIDANGKDQGINVRNRSKELTDLLSDVEKIRAERKKSKTNRTKYSGHEGGGGAFSSSSSSGRYGGFGSEAGGTADGSYGGYDGRVYGDGGGFGGEEASSGFSDTQARQDNFEEYDEFEDGGASKKKASAPPAARREGKKAVVQKPKEPEVDLFDFNDEPTTTATHSSNLGFDDFQSSSAPADDDDFDDFQSAPTASAPAPVSSNIFSIPAPSTTSSFPISAPKPQVPAQNQPSSDPFNVLSFSGSGNHSASSSTIISPPSTTSSQMKPTQGGNYQPGQPNYFTSIQASSAVSTPSARTTVDTTPGGLGKPLAPIGSTKKPAGDAFAGLLGGFAAKKPGASTANKGQTMADLARQKASAGIWGGGSTTSGGSGVSTPIGSQSAASTPAPGQQKLGNGLDDLLG